MQKSTEQRYLTKAEAADYLRCSLRTIDYLRERNKLKSYRVDRKKLLFDRDELDAFVRQQSADLDKIVDDVINELRDAR